MKVLLLLCLAALVAGQQAPNSSITVSFSGPLTGLTWSDVLTDADTESLKDSTLTDEMLLQTIKLEGIDQGNVAIKLESDSLEAMGAVPKAADGQPRKSAYIVINALEFQYRVAPRPILEQVGGVVSAKTNKGEIQLQLSFTEPVNFTTVMKQDCQALFGAANVICSSREACGENQLCLAQASIVTSENVVVKNFKRDGASASVQKFMFTVSTIDPTKESAIEVKVISEAAKNKQKIANEQQVWSIVYDPIPPVPNILYFNSDGSTSEPFEATASPITVTVKFLEEVSYDFSATDLIATNKASVEEPKQILGDSICRYCFTVQINPTKTGPFTLQVKGGSVRDMAINNNTASSVKQFSYNPPRPKLTIFSSVVMDTSQASIPFTFQFDHQMDLARFNENLQSITILNGKIEAGAKAKDVTVFSKQNTESHFTVDVKVAQNDGKGIGRFPVRVSVFGQVTVQKGTEIYNDPALLPAEVMYNSCLMCSYTVANQTIRMQATCTEKAFPQAPTCVCKPGFNGDGTKCVACPGFDGTDKTKPCAGHGTCVRCDSAEGLKDGGANCDKTVPFSSYCVCEKQDGKPKWGGTECKTNLLTSAVENFKATILTFDSVLLTWSLPESKEVQFPITAFEVTYSKTGDVGLKKPIKIMNNGVTSYTITDLTPYEKPYVFEIQSINDVGVSNAVDDSVLLSPQMDSIFWEAAPVSTGVVPKKIKGDTRGGDIVYINGTNFIPDAQDKDSATRISQIDVTVGVTRKIACIVTFVTNEQIVCTMSAGAGANHTVEVRNIGSKSTAVKAVAADGSLLVYSYVQPRINADSLKLKKNQDSLGTGNVIGNYPQSDELVFEGYGFGDSATEPNKIQIRYGITEPFFECRVNDDKEGETPQIFHTKAYCKTSYGNGVLLPFQIEVAGQKSIWSFDTFSYADTPNITSVSGCFADLDSAGDKTIDCDTRGFRDVRGEEVPIKITITGERFGDEKNDLNVFIRGEVCRDPQLNPDLKIPPNNNKLTCILPKGTGSRVPVMISRHQFLSPPKPFLSYGIPKVRCITGCSKLDFCPSIYANVTSPAAVDGSAKDCPRETRVRITITGENFGYQNAEVYVAGEECSDVIHNSTDPHRVLSCWLPEPTDTGAERTVVVIQENGESSRNMSGKLAYKKCLQGEFHDKNKKFHCSDCVAGKYTLFLGLTICNDCNKGEFNNNSKSISCQPCEETFYQPEEGKEKCIPCQKGRYAAKSGAWQCQQCDAGTYVWMQQCTKCPSFGVKCESGLALAKKDYYVYPDEPAKARFKVENPQNLPDFFPEYEGIRCPANYCAPPPPDGDPSLVEKCSGARTGVLCGDCLTGYYPSGSKCYRCQISDEWLLIVPFIFNWMVVLFIFMTSRDEGSAYDGITKIFLFFIQTTTLFFTINRLGTDFAVFLAFFTFNSLAYMNFNVNDIGEGMCFQSTPLLNLNTGIIQPIVSVFQLLVMFAGHYVFHTIKQKRNETANAFQTGPYRRAFVALFLFVFYSLTSSCVSILSCVDIIWKGSVPAAVSLERGIKADYIIADYMDVPGWRLQDTVVVAAPSVSCLKSPYEILRAIAISIEALKAIFIFVSLFFIIAGYRIGHFANFRDVQVDTLDGLINQYQYNQDGAEYKKAVHDKVELEKFYNNWSGVFRGYDFRHFYWEYVMSARRYSVIFIVSFLHEAYDRYFGLSLVCIGSLVLHVISYPFSLPREHLVNVRPGQYAWNVLMSVNHLETMSLSVLALLVQLMLSENPDREAIVITKVALILLTVIVLGFALVYVVFMEKIGYKMCNKFVEQDDVGDKPVVAVEEDEEHEKNGPTMDVPDVDDDHIPQAVDEEHEKDEDANDKGNKDGSDSDDPYAVHKPAKETGDGETGDDDTGGDTLETDGVDGTGDTDGSDGETEDTLDKDLDEALVASAVGAATKKKGKANEEHPDLDEALAASAEEAARQAADENID